MKMGHGHWLPNNERDALLGRRARDTISGGVYALIKAKPHPVVKTPLYGGISWRG